MLAAAFLAFVQITGNVPASPSDSSEEEICAFIVGPPGERQVKEDASLSVLRETRKAGLFAYPVPTGAVAIRCARSSIIPARFDHEIVAAGLQLYLMDALIKDEASANLSVLEMHEGTISYRYMKGTPTSEEERVIADRLGEFRASPLIHADLPHPQLNSGK